MPLLRLCHEIRAAVVDMPPDVFACAADIIIDGDDICSLYVTPMPLFYMLLLFAAFFFFPPMLLAQKMMF